MKKEKNYAKITSDGKVITFSGKDVTSEVNSKTLSTAIENKETVMYLDDTGKWKRETYLPASLLKEAKDVAKTLSNGPTEEVVETPVMKLIKLAIAKKPVDLYIEDLKWKYLCRSSIRGKNLLMIGGTGTGKTYTAQQAAKALGREFFSFNLGATQDPRSTLIGNTHFKGGTDEGSGTFFNSSLFVKAIQIPNASILLDEISRANPEAWNILMPVLDEGQRYLRLDEQEGSPTIKVAEGVSFIATANIGSEFTSTRVMDRALLDRFTIIEVDYLPEHGEVKLLTNKFPDLRKQAIEAIANIAEMSRKELQTDDPRITTPISTRSTLELAGLMSDGFSLYEACEVAVYPFYDSEGGENSDRTFVRQIVQKWSHVDTPVTQDEDGNVVEEDGDELFNLDEDSF